MAAKPPVHRFLEAHDNGYRVRLRSQINVGSPVAPGQPRGTLPYGARGVIGQHPPIPAEITCEFGDVNDVPLPPSDAL